MYKVLLVDDELLDLSGLECFMNWDEMDMEVCAAASSGFEALEVLETEQVDIIVTDIKMPIMTGMELARRALELNPQLKIVFVSGYEDFQYAKQAISLSACGYVLKPVDDDDLRRTLMDVKGNLDKERAQSHLEHYFSESEPLLKRELFIQLLDGVPDEGKAMPLLRRMGIPWHSATPLYTALLEPDDLAWKLNGYSEAARAEIEQQLSLSVEQFCTGQEIQFCRLDPFHYALILEERVEHEALRELIMCAVSGTPLSVTVGAGPLVTGLKELHYSFRRAKEAVELKLFLGKGKLILHTDARGPVTARAKDLDDILQALFQAMSSYRLVAVDDCMEELFVGVAHMETKLEIYQLFLHVVTKLDAYLHTINEDFYMALGLDRKRLSILYHFETTQDMKSWLRRRMFELSEHLQRKRQGKKRKLVQEITAYIEERLEQNVMLRDAANHFSFSPNHLGQIFYEETGSYFSDYVSLRRLERVKLLLGDPKLKVYEAAQQAGYKNLSHFSKQFKDYYGISPGDYRRHL
ncbi:response regulator [Paenibacillus sp. MMS20-IR301]|uniref:response regulator n=1 Tax=Paenibacillus sp. MMS20-IR301 TaxID=2895946 RepID=UPI0028E1A2C1|nr:response regulator [Paenibacillus sp. MMS20-IR301]WNS45423.1 response regulator [Paenibacillus sp. MMS20-IR301]